MQVEQNEKSIAASLEISDDEEGMCVTPFISPYPFPSCLSLLLLIYPYFPYLA